MNTRAMADWQADASVRLVAVLTMFDVAQADVQDFLHSHQPRWAHARTVTYALAREAWGLTWRDAQDIIRPNAAHSTALSVCARHMLPPALWRYPARLAASCLATGTARRFDSERLWDAMRRTPNP